MGRKISLTKVAVKGEHAQRDYVFLSEGKTCELCGNEAYCLDHVFSRTVRALFFFRANLLRICRKCHYLKTHNIRNFLLVVYDHIKQRDGDNIFDFMWKLAKKNAPFKEWCREYVEEKIDYYKTQTELLNSGYTK